MDTMRVEATGARFVLFLSDRIVAADIAEEIRLQRPDASLLSPENRAEFMAVIDALPPSAKVFVELELLGSFWEEAHRRLVGRQSGIVLFGDIADDLAARGDTVAGAAILARPYSSAELTALVGALPSGIGARPEP